MMDGWGQGGGLKQEDQMETGEDDGDEKGRTGRDS